jgi:hypothetical protein
MSFYSPNYRKSSVHDDLSSTGQGHASSQFAHHHHHKSKLVKDSSHSVKKKSRKLSEKVISKLVSMYNDN